MWDDEDRAKPKAAISLPRGLEPLSVEDLREYLETLDGEKARVQAEIERKKSVRAAADNFFKS